MSLIEIEGLKVDYQLPDGASLRVLNIPNFQVKEGEQICIKGHSGSGKTTFLNVISGILLPTSGYVVFDAISLTEVKEAQRDFIRGKSIGFIFQTFHLLSGFTALENVLLASVFAGNPDEQHSATKIRAAELLEKVGLKERMHHRPRMLSSGEQQRVAIARALMNHPKLILADEPTGSLDETNGREVLDLIRNLASSSKTALILVTHDPAVMSKFERVIDLQELT